MKYYEDYVGYFENLALKHTLIDHDPDNDKKGFFRVNLEEVLTGIRNAIESDGYFMVLTNYIWSPIDDNANPLKKIECMFYILGKVEKDNYEHYTEVLVNCEKIATQIMNRISLDSKKQGAIADSFFYGSQDSLEFENAVPVELVKGTDHHGYQITFSINAHYSKCVDHTIWDDLDEYDADSNNF